MAVVRKHRASANSKANNPKLGNKICKYTAIVNKLKLQ